MNILFCQPTLERSGSELSLATIVDGLRETGDERLYLLAGRGGPLREFFERQVNGCDVIDAPKLQRRARTVVPFLRSFWTTYRRMRSIHRRRRLDLVYVNTLVFPQAILASAALRLPCIVHVREVSGRYPRLYYSLLTGLAGIVARRFVTVSNFVAEQDVLAVRRRIRPRARTVYNASAEEPPFSERTPSRPLQVLIVAGVTRRKGADLIPEVAAELHSGPLADAFRMTVVGRVADRELQAEINATLEEKGLTEMVRFAGEQTDLAPFYREAHILLHPSRFEAFPRVLVEAASAGLPVVTTDTGGAPEAVVDGRTGFVVPVGDAVAMAQAIHTLAADPAAYRAFAAAAHTHYHEVFSRRRMIDGIRQVISDATS